MKVGTIFARQRRYREDEEYRKKRLERARKRRNENRLYYINKSKKWRETINKFTNKRCKICNKILTYTSTTYRCKEHRFYNGDKI